MSGFTHCRCAVAVVSAGLVIGLAACGAQADQGDSQDHASGRDEDDGARELLSQVLAVTDGVRAVREETEMEARGSVVEFVLEVDGEGRCRQAVTFPDVGTVETIRVDDEVWVSPAAPYWMRAGGAGTLLKYEDMYVHGPADNPDLASSAESCDLSKAFNKLDPSTQEYPSTVSFGPEADHEGQPAFTLLIDREEPAGAVSSTLLVAADGEPYPLRMTTELVFSDSSIGTMTHRNEWRDFGGSFEVEIPAPAMTVGIEDLSAKDNPFPLGGGGRG